jgi:hypothetical protein
MASAFEGEKYIRLARKRDKRKRKEQSCGQHVQDSY